MGERNRRWRLGGVMAAFCVALVALLFAVQSCAVSDVEPPVPSVSGSVNPEAAARIEERRRKRDRARAGAAPAESAGEALPNDPARSEAAQDSPGDLIVRVEDAVGVPVTGGVVLLLPTGAGSPVQWDADDVLRAPIDATGTARFAGLTGLSHWLCAHCGDQGALPVQIRIPPSRAKTVIVSAGRPLIGRVVWEDDAPARFATLQLTFARESDPDGRIPSTSARAKTRMIPGYTDEQGRFAFPVLPLDALQTISIRATATHRESELRLVSAVQSWRLDELPNDGDLRVRLVERIGVGRVLDLLGRPVGEASLSDHSGRGQYARTDFEGRFRLNLGVAPLADIWVHMKGHPPSQAFPPAHSAHSVRSQSGEIALGDVRLVRGCVLTGQLMDSEGHALGVRTVRLFAIAELQILATARSNPAGEFSLPAVSAGTYRLQVSRSLEQGRSSHVHSQVVVVSRDQRIDVRVSAEASRVELTVQLNGLPARSGGTRLALLTTQHQGASEPTSSLRSLNDGETTFTVFLEEEGTYEITLKAMGFALSTHRDVTLKRNTRNVVIMDLERAPERE